MFRKEFMRKLESLVVCVNVKIMKVGASYAF